MRERINLFYFNIFKFECFTQYWIPYPLILLVRSTGFFRFLGRRNKIENFEEHLLDVLNDSKGGMSLHFTGIHITALLTVLLGTPWNLICGLLKIKIDPWFYGGLVVVALAVVASNYLAPSDTTKYLNDFKKFESMPKAWKRKSALLTFLIVLGIWTAFILSFIYNLESSLA